MGKLRLYLIWSYDLLYGIGLGTFGYMLDGRGVSGTDSESPAEAQHWAPAEWLAFRHRHQMAEQELHVGFPQQAAALMTARQH